MTNASRARGTAWEVKVVDFLQSRGHREVYRMAPGGIHDAGDVGGLPDWAIEARDRAKISLAENCDDAVARAREKRCRYGIAFIKRRGRPVTDAYVVMPAETWADLLDELDRD